MSPKRYLATLALLASLVTLLLSPQFSSAASPKASPKTKIRAVTETLHGVTISDPYRWLEDQNSPETRAWIEAQNEHTRSILDTLPERAAIRRRLEALLRIDTISAPASRGGRYFFTKRSRDQNHSVLYMRNGPAGSDQVLLDPNTMSPDLGASASFQGISEDGKLVAYGVRSGGEDEQTIGFLDVDSLQQLPDRFPKARYSSVSFLPDKSGFYYSRYTPAGFRVYFHPMGTDPAADQEIFGKGYGPQHIISVDLAPDGRYLSFSVRRGSTGEKVELYLQNLEKKGPISPVVTDLEARFSARLAGDHMFLHTNWQAPNGRILAVNLQNPARETWREVVAETAFPIQGFSLAGGRLFVNYLENVRSRTRIIEPSGKQVGEISFPTLGSGGFVLGRWTNDEAFFSFNSLALPTTIYRYQVSTGKQEVWARIQVSLHSDQVEIKQVWFQSKDKTKVPMFLAYKKGTPLDGNRPTLLTGYGGFNVSETPSFSPRAAFWVESGGVFALPNLRGGGEFGEQWHRAGMLEKKQNVFDDFLAAAEWLTENGYTRPSRLAILGGSNGGLLVGAALTQRPELFGAVVCAVPLLDMLRYHRFLVARFWVTEYGTAEDLAQFAYIRRYSPYHNVKDGAKYPPVLFTTGDSDTRVDPSHARKMAARLQAATASGKPVLLQYDTKAGHAGGLPVSRQIEDLTDVMSFLFWQLAFKPQEYKGSVPP